MSGVIESGTCVRSLQIDYDDEVEFFAIQKIYDLVRFEEENTPFYLTVSFTHPHSPFICKPEYWNRFRHEDVAMPTVPEFALDDMDEMSRWLYYAHGQDLDEVKDEHILNARHAYYGMVSYVDDKVGRIVKTLEEVGIRENTVIIFGR